MGFRRLLRTRCRKPSPTQRSRTPGSWDLRTPLYNANYNRSVEANDVPQRLVLSYLLRGAFRQRAAVLYEGRRRLRPGRMGGHWNLGVPKRPPYPDYGSRSNAPAQLFSYERACQPAAGSRAHQWPEPEPLVQYRAFAVAAPYTIPTDSLSEPNLRSPRRINTDFSLIKNIAFRNALTYSSARSFSTFSITRNWMHGRRPRI